MKHKYGWKRQPIDERDHKYALKVMRLPSKVNQSMKITVRDQMTIGACTGFGICYAVRHMDKPDKNGVRINPSPLFLYYNERWIEGTINEDAGAVIRDGFKALKKWGICQEPLHPYIPEKFNVKPSESSYVNALLHQTGDYQAVPQTLCDMQQALATGHLVVGGIQVYENLETDAVDESGNIPMPEGNEIGGHCIALHGYDNKRKQFLLVNSWSNTWGRKGFGTIPYDYWLNPDLASDFWVLTKVP
jgi:C1A family cysteine protease